MYTNLLDVSFKIEMNFLNIDGHLLLITCDKGSDEPAQI